MRVIIIPSFTESGSEVRDIEIKKDDFLSECYDLIDCRCIDIVPVHKSLNEPSWHLVVDDEGLLKEDCKLNFIAWSMYSLLNENAPIVGNCMLVKLDEDGNTVSLTQRDVDKAFDLFMIVVNAFGFEHELEVEEFT